MAIIRFLICMKKLEADWTSSNLSDTIIKRQFSWSTRKRLYELGLAGSVRKV